MYNLLTEAHIGAMTINPHLPTQDVADLQLEKSRNPEINGDPLGHVQFGALEQYPSINSRELIYGGSQFSKPPPVEEGELVRLVGRRGSKNRKQKTPYNKLAGLSKLQGRPLSKQTTVRLTLVPTLGILYSLLMSDTMRKPLQVLKYSDEKDAESKIYKELSTKNTVSGFSNMLNFQMARIIDDPNVSLNTDTDVPEFNTIDEAVCDLFGITEYSLIRITRAAATEVGGSVVLKIETAMPGYFYLMDDEEDIVTVEKNKELYRDFIGFIGDRPTTAFLKRYVARPRYKADMRIYLIPKVMESAIYCSDRIFKRDLLCGFLDLERGERSIISAFGYQDFLENLELQGNGDLITRYGLPCFDEAKENERDWLDHRVVDQLIDCTNYSCHAMLGALPLINTHSQPSSHKIYELLKSPVSDTSHRSFCQEVEYLNQNISLPEYIAQHSLPNTYIKTNEFPINVSQTIGYPLIQCPTKAPLPIPRQSPQPPQLKMQTFVSGQIPLMCPANHQQQQHQQLSYPVYMNPPMDSSPNMMTYQEWVHKQQEYSVNSETHVFPGYSSCLPNGQGASDQYQIITAPLLDRRLGE
jgi:hypothetical protein